MPRVPLLRLPHIYVRATLYAKNDNSLQLSWQAFVHFPKGEHSDFFISIGSMCAILWLKDKLSTGTHTRILGEMEGNCHKLPFDRDQGRVKAETPVQMSLLVCTEERGLHPHSSQTAPLGAWAPPPGGKSLVHGQRRPVLWVAQHLWDECHITAFLKDAQMTTSCWFRFSGLQCAREVDHS